METHHVSWENSLKNENFCSYVKLSESTFGYNNHKPPMTGNGEHTNYRTGDDWGMVYFCYTHIKGLSMFQWIG